ncbi:hypothetical protein Bca4012_037788 [Brassica carinata]
MPEFISVSETVRFMAFLWETEAIKNYIQSSSLTFVFTPSPHSFQDLSFNASLLPIDESAAINRIEYSSLLLHDFKAFRCTTTIEVWLQKFW